MAKLYPPYLEGTIPAFYGNSITVPFAMNRAVGKNEIRGFSLLIKSIQTGNQLGKELKAFKYDLENGTATFNLNSDLNPTKYLVGQSYKFQLAYIGNGGSVGYYSTVAIAKYTEPPTIEIKNLVKHSLNKHIYNYIGEYKTKDITEKMYSCQFKVYDQNKNIIADTGEIIHNSLNDEVPKVEGDGRWYRASEQFDLIQELDAGKNYYIQFLVKTIGLMELDTGLYQIVQGEPIPPLPKHTIVVDASLNYDNGYIDINMKHFNNSLMTGKYVLSRASSKDNFKSWNEIMRFTLNKETKKEIWKDFTIEQGVQYKYAVFMVDKDNRYSTKSVSNIVLADFEDMFLFDGDRQLKIRFDPNVSSFKNTILESKTDTIGGKHPYIFRNGHVNYKEFAVSGLLSHLTDTDGYFEVALAQTKYNDNTLAYGAGLYNTQLNAENFAMERDFKLEALDWLTNGKPKLFRSPAEGNYIIRLTDVSLSPVDSIGRMLHNFSGTAYEIKEYTHKNLIETGLIKDNLLIGINKIIETKSTGGVSLANLDLSTNYLERIGISQASGLKFNIPPSSKKVYVEINGSDVNVSLSSDFSNFKITSLKKSGKQTSDYNNTDTFSLQYEEETIPNINKNISNIDSIEVPIIQFSGAKDVYFDTNKQANLLNRFLSKSNEYLSQLFLIKCSRRNPIHVKIKNDKWDNLYNYVYTEQSVTEDKNALYAVHNDFGELLGYKDHGVSLKLTEWPSLKNLTSDSAKFSLQLTDKSYKTETKIVGASGLTLDSSMIDFNDLDSIKTNLFLDIIFCCRLGSKVLSNNPDNPDYKDYDYYKGLLESFQSGEGYDNQKKLEALLKKIQNCWTKGVLKDESST